MTDASTAFSAQDDTSQAMSDRAKQGAEEMLDALKGRAADFVDAGREKAFGLTSAIEKQIRDRPVQALAVAAGIGFAVGLLYTRRS